MAQPARKSAEVRSILNAIAGQDTEEKIKNDQCLDPPIGCGKKIDPRAMTEMEYTDFTITGLCEECQRKFLSD